MSDLISRQAAIKAVEEERFPVDSDYAEGFMAALDKVGWILKEWLPSAEPDIIRCKDCRRYNRRPCGLVNWYNGKEDFCSRAERRGEEKCMP